MKFAKDLASSIIAEWSDDYIDYKRLKTVLASCVEAGTGPEGADTFHDAVEQELEKVNRFYVEKTKEYETTVVGLAPPSTQTSPPPPPPPANSTPGGSRPAALIKGGVDDHDKLVQLNVVYRRLGQLQNYVWINAQGFSKIMKKFDKRFALRGTGYKE
jgi:SPX domain protein involved in polyphosphate accumulation